MRRSSLYLQSVVRNYYFHPYFQPLRAVQVLFSPMDGWVVGQVSRFIKRPAREACLCMGDLQAPPAPATPHFVFLITL